MAGSSATDDEERTLAETIRELANQPAGHTRMARRRQHLLAVAERWTTVGPLAPAADVAWAANRRISKVGGSALAALIAYRLFVWLLPLALLSVVAIQLGGADTIDAKHATDRFGIAGYVAASVSTATADTGGPRVASAVIAAVFLLYETYALIRGLRAVHALAWGVRLSPVRRPARATLLTLAGLVGLVVVGGLLDGLRDVVGPLLGLLLLVAGLLVLPACWLGVSYLLPNRARSWTDLLPGAILVGAAASLLHLVVVYVLFPYLQAKSARYGALGLAAGLMLALYAIGLTFAAGAALNAELAERRARRPAPGAAPSLDSAT